MTNTELEQRLSETVANERRTTVELLNLINVAMQRRLYLERGFSSMFDWLVRGFGYSESAAYRRISAARLLKMVPDAGARLESGQVSLSSLAHAQSVMRAQEKKFGTKVSAEIQAQVVEQIGGKSRVETDRTLISMFPDVAPVASAERAVAVDESTTRLSVNLPLEVMKDLDRVKELLSHALPDGDYARAIARIAREFLERNDPLRKPISEAKKWKSTSPTKNMKSASAAKNLKSTSAAKKTCVTSVRRQTIQKAGGRCTYKDAKTGRVCGTRYQAQVDHIVPRALGGGNEPENLRCLCGKHNRLMAEKILGDWRAAERRRD